MDTAMVFVVLVSSIHQLTDTFVHIITYHITKDIICDRN